MPFKKDVLITHLKKMKGTGKQEFSTSDIAHYVDMTAIEVANLLKFVKGITIIKSIRSDGTKKSTGRYQFIPEAKLEFEIKCRSEKH